MINPDTENAYMNIISEHSQKLDMQYDRIINIRLLNMYVYLKIQVFIYTVIKIGLIPFNYIEQQL